MRNLLYSLVFVLVLLLAGSAGVQGVDGLDGVGGHTLWLPVVGKADRPETCNYNIQWDMTEHYVVKLDEPVTVAFSWKYDGGGYNDPYWSLGAFNNSNPSSWWKHYLFRNSEHDGLSSASETFTIQPEDGPSQPGVYWWDLFALCTIAQTIPAVSSHVQLIIIYE